MSFQVPRLEPSLQKDIIVSCFRCNKSPQPNGFKHHKLLLGFQGHKCRMSLAGLNLAGRRSFWRPRRCRFLILSDVLRLPRLHGSWPFLPPFQSSPSLPHDAVSPGPSLSPSTPSKDPWDYSGQTISFKFSKKQPAFPWLHNVTYPQASGTGTRASSGGRESAYRRGCP